MKINNMKTTSYTIISSSAIVFDRDGYIQHKGTQVCDFGDIVTVGTTEHNKGDLTITDTTITSIHGWTVQL